MPQRKFHTSKNATVRNIVDKTIDEYKKSKRLTVETKIAILDHMKKHDQEAYSELSNNMLKVGYELVDSENGIAIKIKPIEAVEAVEPVVEGVVESPIKQNRAELQIDRVDNENSTQKLIIQLFESKNIAKQIGYNVAGYIGSLKMNKSAQLFLANLVIKMVASSTPELVSDQLTFASTYLGYYNTLEFCKMLNQEFEIVDKIKGVGQWLMEYKTKWKAEGVDSETQTPKIDTKTTETQATAARIQTNTTETQATATINDIEVQTAQPAGVSVPAQTQQRPAQRRGFANVFDFD